MFGKKKGFCILHGTDVDVFYLKKLDYVDHACYEEKYWGDEYNTIMRYEKNPDSYIFIEDLETGNLAGYLNFFPCEDKLYQDNLWRSEVIRDDDIMPEEIAEYRAEGNHLFIRLQTKEGLWTLRFRDDCKAFDPVSHIAGVTRADENVGIRLAMRIADEARYTYSMNLNNLTLILRNERS